MADEMAHQTVDLRCLVLKIGSQVLVEQVIEALGVGTDGQQGEDGNNFEHVCRVS